MKQSTTRALTSSGRNASVSICTLSHIVKIDNPSRLKRSTSCPMALRRAEALLVYHKLYWTQSCPLSSRVSESSKQRPVVSQSANARRQRFSTAHCTCYSGDELVTDEVASRCQMSGWCLPVRQCCFLSVTASARRQDESLPVKIRHHAARALNVASVR